MGERRDETGNAHVDDLPSPRPEQFVGLAGQAVPENHFGSCVGLVDVHPVQAAAEGRVPRPQAVPVRRTPSDLVVEHDHPARPGAIPIACVSASPGRRSHGGRGTTLFTTHTP